jgi:type II secretory pathway component PulL
MLGAGYCTGRRRSQLKKIGFIDLNSRTSGDIYVFRDSRGEYELERSFEYTAGDASAPSDLSGLSDLFLSLPVELLNFRLLKLPFSDKEKLTKIVPFELEGLMMEGPDEVVFDATVLGGAGDQFDVLVTFIRRDILQEILTKLGSLRLDPQIVTCLDVRSIVKKGVGDIASWLMSPGELSREERIDTARGELQKNTLNLRTGPLAYTRDTEKVMKKLRTTLVLVFLLALLVNSFFVFKIAIARNETASIKREMRNIYSGLFPREKRITDELYQMKAHMKETREKGDALIGVYPLQFLLDLSGRTVAGVAISEINIERDLAVIKGEASSMAEVDKMKAKISEFLADASVSDVKQTGAGKLYFTITAKRRSS